VGKNIQRKSPMSNGGSRKALFLNNRQMKSNFSGIIYFKCIKYHVLSRAAMCHTKPWQSTSEEMQHIMHHDKATVHQINDPHELEHGKKYGMLHSHCKCIAHGKKLQEISHQHFILYQTTALIVCIFSFYGLELRTFPQSTFNITTVPLFDINWYN
jgi:hypothetical protein